MILSAINFRHSVEAWFLIFWVKP